MRIARMQAIANTNLEQAERKWMACHESTFYTLGDAIYRCVSTRSDLTVAHLPEVREAGL